MKKSKTTKSTLHPVIKNMTKYEFACKYLGFAYVVVIIACIALQIKNLFTLPGEFVSPIPTMIISWVALIIGEIIGRRLWVQVLCCYIASVELFGDHIDIDHTIESCSKSGACKEYNICMGIGHIGLILELILAALQNYIAVFAFEEYANLEVIKYRLVILFIAAIIFTLSCGMALMKRSMVNIKKASDYF